MRVTASVSGQAAIQRELRRISQKAARSGFSMAALRAGGEVIADEARARVDVRKGELRDSIGVGDDAKFAEADSNPHVFVGPDERMSARGTWEEEGTINQPADPFLRPALDAGADRAVAVIGDGLKGEIKR